VPADCFGEEVTKMDISRADVWSLLFLAIALAFIVGEAVSGTVISRLGRTSNREDDPGGYWLLFGLHLIVWISVTAHWFWKRLT
jgi:hypothetical protein